MLQTNIIQTITSKGYISQIVRTFDPTSHLECVRYRANADIDADGANGQHGLPAAYRMNNEGRDVLADVGYPRYPDEYSQGLICASGTRTPLVFPPNIYASRTAYKMVIADGSTQTFEADDPRIGVDAEFFPYIVTPPSCKTRTLHKLLGSRVTVINHQNGLLCIAVVADIGPKNKDGEISPCLARRLGIPDSPRTGGTDSDDIEYFIEVGIPATVTGEDKLPFTFALQ